MNRFFLPTIAATTTMRTFSSQLALFALLLTGFLMRPAMAQDFVRNVSNNGTMAAAFLEMGVGARAEALGGAYTAQAGHAEMIYWNPAGLAYLDGLSVSFMHSEWLADMNFDFATVVVPTPFFNSVVGVSFTTLGVPEQAVRTETEPDGTGQFYDARDYAVNVSVAAQLISSFSVGVTGKYIRQRIWSETASQIALDVGVYYQTPLQGLSLGASIANFGDEMRLSGKNLNNIIDPDPFNEGIENLPVEYRTEGAPLPQIFRFGVAYEQSLGGRSSIVTAVNLLHPTGATESLSFGLEYGWNDLLFLRGGYQNLYERNAINGLTLGGGIQARIRDLGRAAIDYAWSDWGVLDKAHRLSFSIYL